MVRSAFPTDQVIKFLTGEHYTYAALQDTLLGRMLTTAQLRRSRDLCVAELIYNQHTDLKPATDPEHTKRPLRFMAWAESMSNRTPLTCVGPCTPARNFPLRDILFVVCYGSLVIDDDARRIHSLLEFMLDVPNDPTFASQARRFRARAALLLRLPQLKAVNVPEQPLNRHQQGSWFRELEQLYGKTMLVTALPPKTHDAPVAAQPVTKEGLLITMPHRREPMYS